MQSPPKWQQVIGWILSGLLGAALIASATMKITKAPPVVEKFPVGMPLVQRGKPITPRQLFLLEEEHRAFLRSLTTADHARRGIAVFLVMALLATMASMVRVFPIWWERQDFRSILVGMTLPVLCIVGLWTGSYAAVLFLTILGETAAGNDDVKRQSVGNTAMIACRGLWHNRR